ncbi:MAG: sensor histidine kinase [Flavobacteriales bacterium]|nr:sensor histidine kinase [Flavobacteriales bacterium]
MSNPKKLFLYILIIINTDWSWTQKQIDYKGFKIYLDSIFLTNAYPFKFKESTIDSLIELEKDLQPQVFLFYCKALHLINKNQKFKEAEYYFLQSARLIDKYFSDFKLYQAAVSFQLGLLSQVYSPEERLFWLHRADSLALLYSKHPLLIVGIKAEMVELYRKMQKLDLALNIIYQIDPYIDKLELQNNISVKINFASIFNQYGTFSGDTSFYKKSFLISDSILKLPEINNFPQLKALALAEKASSMSILFPIEKSLPYYLEAYELYKKYGDDEDIFNHQINLFHVYYKMNNYNKVIELADSLLPHFNSFNLEERKNELYKILSHAYTNKGNYKKANEFLYKYIEERDKLDRLKHNRLIEDLEKKHQTALKDQEIIFIKRENELKQAEYNRKKKENNLLFIISLVIGILLIIATIFMLQFYYARKRIREQALLLKKNNELLTEAIKQKEFLYKELNHRVKNNLQLITSFIGLQLKSKKLISSEEFALEIQKKISAISMVHEMLYKSKLDEKIDIKYYLTELGEYLLDSSNNLNVESIDFIVEGDTTFLTVDQAVPIGLIINEMITNSIKYAFNENNLCPEIHITIKNIDNTLKILVKDNGIGFENEVDLNYSNSLGTKAIKLLSEQLKGHVKKYNQHGAVWEIEIPIK